MTDYEQILIARGVELCAEWDKHDEAMARTRQKWDIHYHDEKRLDAGIRLDELCLLARTMEIASYDDFRERIQKTYENAKEEMV